MQRRVIISNGKRFLVNVAGFSEDVGPSAPMGTLWMQSITDGFWYEINVTGTSGSTAIYVNPTPLTWQSPGQDFGYQLLLCPDDGKVYQTYLSGSGNNVTMSVSQTPWASNADYKPYLLLESKTDGYMYPVFIRSGSIYFKIEDNYRVWMNGEIPYTYVTPEPSEIYFRVTEDGNSRITENDLVRTTG